MPLGDLERLKISAILHDIGKLECWANREGWSEHTKYTKQFVRSCFGEELAEDACRHHLGISYPDAYRPKTLTQQIICLADSIAAGADRHETPSHGPPIPTPPRYWKKCSGRRILKFVSRQDPFLSYPGHTLCGTGSTTWKPSS